MTSTTYQTGILDPEGTLVSAELVACLSRLPCKGLPNLAPDLANDPAKDAAPDLAHELVALDCDDPGTTRTQLQHLDAVLLSAQATPGLSNALVHELQADGAARCIVLYEGKMPVLPQGLESSICIDMAQWSGLALSMLIIQTGNLTRCLREMLGLHLELQDTRQRLLQRNRKLLDKNQKLHYLAITDVLTGVFNRRYLDMAIERDTDRRNRYGGSLSLLIVDIDHFKLFNDCHGHEGGDRVLSALGRLLRDQARRSDVVGRYGGEEFVLLLPSTAPEQAWILAERLRQSVSTLDNTLAEQTQPITLSIGVAGVTASDPETSAQVLLELADRALYAAKATGRNRTVQINSDGLGRRCAS